MEKQQYFMIYGSSYEDFQYPEVTDLYMQSF